MSHLQFVETDEENRKAEARIGHTEKASHNADEVKLVYFACITPNQDVIDTLDSLTKANIQIVTSEIECVEYITPMTNKIFLIIDDLPSTTLIESIEPLKQIDSVFIYSSSSDSITPVVQTQHSYLINWCENKKVLIDRIKNSREELVNQIIAFSMFHKRQKAVRDISKEGGSFTFFQLMNNLVRNISKTAEAKKIMITICRNYYRGNLTELKNIDEFDQFYRSVDAIPWFLKETFVYKLINKALRTEDIDVLFQFRFYMRDLSEQLQLHFLQLKEKQKDVLKLYRGSRLSLDELRTFQESIGNVISPNGYLSTTNEFSVAIDFVTKSPKREGFVQVLFEYQVDLKVVQKIVIADVRQYSAFPEEAEFLVDIGATFQIDSCQFNVENDYWHIQVHATDHGGDSAAKYMEYQKEKMTESDICLMFGNLLLEMGEYAKAEKYFDTILSSLNPNDEETAYIFFNLGRTYRSQGNFDRAINCYNRAYNLYMTSKPPRVASAGKTLNGLGIIYSEQEKQLKAEECFQRAMQLYKNSIPKNHVDVAGTLINLATIDCDRQDYSQALSKYLKARKIYNSSLPPGHPNQALSRMNLGNVYLLTGDYKRALEEYENALKIQESSLPRDHPDIFRTLHNLAVVHARRGNMKLAKEYLQRTEETPGYTLTSNHPLTTLLGKTKNVLAEEV